MKLRLFDFLAIGGFSIHARAGRNKNGDVVIEASGAQWIACFPNRVFVRVKGNNGQKIDEISS